MVALESGERPSLVREPLECRLPIDAALRCLHDTERPFALVGAWAGGGALLGCSPLRVACEHDDPLELIARACSDSGSAAGVGGGWVGYLGYALRARIERGHPSPPRARPLPEFALAYYDHVVRRDARGAWWFEALRSAERAGELEARRAWWAQRLAQPPVQRAASTSDWRLTPSAGAHAELVAACRERIHAGDLFQANVCAELEGRLHGSPLELFIRGVESLAPDRAAYLEGPWGAVVSLSPELFLQRSGRRVRTAPIKGTRPRTGRARAADAERDALAHSAKDRAENVMIVDLMRNDLGRVCEPGSIAVGPLAQAHAHAGVWHLVSEVAGVLRPGVDDGQLLRATFPPGSVTGAPKIAAMDVIAELESTARQVYTGAIGFVSPQAGLELSVAIRTFEASGSTIRLGVGGGVVADSDPDAEAAELAIKAAPLLGALGAATPRADLRRRAPRVRRLGPLPVPRADPSAGVFETLLVRDRRALHAEAHLARLRTSVAALYGAQLPAGIAHELAAVAASAPGPARLRVDVWPGPGATLEVAFVVGDVTPSAPVRIRAWTLPGGLGPHKWSDRRLIDAVEANSDGELPLLVDADGCVLETTRATVFVLGSDGALRTPPADGRILPGVARAHLLAHAIELGREVLEQPLQLDELARARAVVLTSALRCVPALAIDGRELHQAADVVTLIESSCCDG